MRNKVVDWFEIYVNDMARAKAFYSKVFHNGFISLIEDIEGNTIGLHLKN